MARGSAALWRVLAGITVAEGMGARVDAGPVPRPGAGIEIARDATFAAPVTEMPLDAARPERAVPVRVEKAADVDRFVGLVSDDASVLTVEQGARILPGMTVGYAFVRPLKLGQTTLHIGGAAMKVRVVEGSGASEQGVFTAAPELLAPRAGAAVWGKIEVGVACWRLPDDPAGGPVVNLAIGDAQKSGWIEPDWTTKADEGPLMMMSFPADFSGMQPGPLALRAIRFGADGSEHAGGRAVVQVVSISEGSLSEGECEADYGLMAPNVMGPPKAPVKMDDASASGGAFFPNYAADPRFRYPLTVPEGSAGWYQVMMTVAGDSACAALPSVGITIDEAQRPLTVSTIARPGWHREPIGTPVRLAPGFHVVRCDFVNDFAARGVDRNLKLDRIEIARVADAEADGAKHSGDGAMMSGGGGGGEMMMMGGGSGASAGRGWPASASADVHPTLRVAFERPLDGQVIDCEVEIRGTVWWGEQRNSPPPEVALLVNMREVQRQRSDAPRFVVPVEWFNTGENAVQLLAMSDAGLSVKSEPQRVYLPEGLGGGGAHGGGSGAERRREEEAGDARAGNATGA